MLPLRTSAPALTVGDKRLEAFGCKCTDGGAHISRTMMLQEIQRLLVSAHAGATEEDYWHAVIEDNALGKATDTTRQKTLRHLRELYGLSETIPIFGVYRELVRFDPQSAPLLSLLVAWARDPLLRATTAAILGARPGDRVTGHDLQQAFIKTYPDQYSPLNVAKIARNAASSWTQSGHLWGRTKKIRSMVEPGPAALTLGLLLGYIGQLPVSQLFASTWCRLLDLSAMQARTLAEQAHREELITLKAVGTVIEVGFPRFMRYLRDYL